MFCAFCAPELCNNDRDSTKPYPDEQAAVVFYVNKYRPGCLWCASLHRENYEPWQSFASRWFWLLFLHNMFTLLPLFEPLGYHPLGH